MQDIQLLHGDCLELMKDIPDGSIDFICTDLPYQTTRLKWDCPIDLEFLFLEYERLIKPKGAIALFSNQPFTSKLIIAKPQLYRYSWIWLKPFPTGFLNSNYRPMLSFEDIVIFSKSGAGAGSKENNMNYYPQGLIQINKKKKNKKGSRGQHIHDTVNCGQNNILNSEKEYEQKYSGYPNNVLEFDRDSPQIFATQKPVGLVEYLIKTYSNEGDLILDSTSGSATTAIAAINTNRRCICMEKDEANFEVGKKRVDDHIKSLQGKLF
jgi:site-specific DNA-methyltransferase (adenine-specific)